MTSKEIKCIKMMTPPNSTSCIRFIKFLRDFLLYSNLLSPCSGLVVSGFSKRDPPDITAKGFLAQAITSYKKFKKMYVVDNTTDHLLATDDFIGKI